MVKRTPIFQQYNQYGGDGLSYEEIHAHFPRLLKKHPNTTFIACHLANLGNNLGRLSTLLDQHSNLYLDISARNYEVGHQPRGAAKFLTKYQDRVLFGSMYISNWQMVETSERTRKHCFMEGGECHIFGIGVLGMALSTISLHMLICGLVLCKIMKVSYESWVFRIGIMIPGIGVLGPFFWDQALFWLAIPTSVITLMLLPIAYVAFFLVLNNKAIMGEHLQKRGTRVTWNILLILVIVLVGAASIYILWQYAGMWGIAVLGLFLVLIAVFEWKKRRRRKRKRLIL